MPTQEKIPALFRLPALHAFDLYETTIEQLQGLFASGQLTAVDYVHFCLERIRTVGFSFSAFFVVCPEKQGKRLRTPHTPHHKAIDPYLESVIEVNPDASQIAHALDEERRQGMVRSSLHGIPVLVKDNMATKDKMQTTAGSWALLGSTVPRDAHIVARLRQAGAIILGHANMSEWASLRSKEDSVGYSPRRGQVRNPYDLSRSPAGSSSGSAVAVSANMVPLSLGTETDTSIIGPAATNGIVGIKPTVGLTSRSGVIPISEHMDSVGCFGRTVADATHALDAIVGRDDRDPFTRLPPRRQDDHRYASFLSSKAVLKGAKFGLPWTRCWDWVPEDQKKVASGVLDAIVAAGAEIVRTEFPCAEDRIPEHGAPAESEFTVVKVDAYHNMNAYLSELSDTTIHRIEDIVAYNDANRGTEGAYPGDHPAFPTGQDNLREIVATGGAKDETYHHALRYMQTTCRDGGIDAALRHVRDDGQCIELDALLLCDRKGAGQQIAAQAGYPIICIPIGLDACGLPVSLSVQQSAWREAALVRWASAIEDVVRELRGGRPTPEYHRYSSKNIPVR
ncbi:MAG: hypothetical protein M1826_002283 [Phylliscum demangeonii]|nr:MAG: hypothetical protein M1826_002283 [Phylliscum demangeonii]